jgi:PAS domain S-box-containing protein
VTLLEQLFQLVPDALVFVDGDGLIVAANEQAGAMFGYDREQLIGMPVEALMPEGARMRHRQHRDGYRHNPRVRPMGATGQTLVGMRRDGAVFPVEIALSPVEAEGRSGFLASIRDISETQRARTALLRAGYDRLVAHVGQLALVEHDDETLVERLPGEICETLQADGCAVLGSLSDGRFKVLASQGLDALLALASSGETAAFGEALAAPQVQLVEDVALEAPSALGVLLQSAGFASACVAPLSGRERPAGALLMVARRPRAFGSDAVTCLMSIANLLAGLMRRRRAEELLSHSQRLEAIGQLTGGIAHDFNNLLTVVSGNLQLIELARPDDAEIAALSTSALRAVDHGTALTSKLLAFARRQRLAPRAVEPASMLADLAGILRRTLGDRIQVETQAAADTPTVWVDVSQLESALLNLALNARDAMPRGGDLTIGARAFRSAGETATNELPAGQYVEFTVSDTGLGMTPEVLARAFEPFFTTKEAGKGSGLGLSMVYGFVHQSGGQVRAESRVGYGTRIHIYLPVSREDQTGERTEQGRAPASAGSGSSGTVLVVEDEAGVRDVAVAFLRSLGFDVEAVDGASAAADMLATARRFDLLFSDISLGAGPSGVELADAATRLRPGLPVLLTTGLDAPRDSTAHYEVLPKPYRREELAAAIRRVMRR